MTPAGVEVMRNNNHTVLAEVDAGLGSGFSNAAYANAGAEIVETSEKIYNRADMTMHVKEPMPSEYGLIKKDQILGESSRQGVPGQPGICHIESVTKNKRAASIFPLEMGKDDKHIGSLIDADETGCETPGLIQPVKAGLSALPFFGSSMVFQSGC